MIKKFLFIILFTFCSFLLVQNVVHADSLDDINPNESFIKAKILYVLSSKIHKFEDLTTYDEKLSAQLLEGKEKGKVIAINYSGDIQFGNKLRFNKDDIVVIDRQVSTVGNAVYSLYEPYRLNSVLWIIFGFILLVLIIAGRKGIRSLLGLAISILTIIFYIIPHILDGQDPLTICLIGMGIILVFSTYLVHGVSIKTTVAVISTTLSLFFAIFLALLTVAFTHLLGLGNQDIYNLQLGVSNKINPQGLLLGGILLGALGALNDMTTTQAITIFTLAKENPNQHFSHLLQKSMSIGKEHVASMVNTLVLAYAGSSLAFFIFFSLNPARIPLWVIFNNETTVEEIIKSIVGSSALLLAVPITTILGSYIALHWQKRNKKYYKGLTS